MAGTSMKGGVESLAETPLSLLRPDRSMPDHFKTRRIQKRSSKTSIAGLKHILEVSMPSEWSSDA